MMALLELELTREYIIISGDCKTKQEVPCEVHYIRIPFMPYKHKSPRKFTDEAA